MFLLARNQAHQLTLRVIGSHGFGVAIFQVLLWTIESKHPISTRRYLLRSKLAIRLYPYVFELSAAVRERNAIEVCGTSGRHRCCLLVGQNGHGRSFDASINFGAIVSHGYFDGSARSARADDEWVMLQVDCSRVDRRNVSTRSVGSHPIDARLSAFDYERVVLMLRRWTRIETSILANGLCWLQVHIEVLSPLVIRYRLTLDGETPRACLFAGCEFLLHVHFDRAIRDNNHAAALGCRAFYAEVHPSRCGVGTEARRFQSVVSIGKQSLDHLGLVVVAERVSGTSVTLGRDNDIKAANIIRHVGDGHFNRIIRVPDQGNTSLESLACY